MLLPGRVVGFVLLIPLVHLVGGMCLFELVAKPSGLMQTDVSEGFESHRGRRLRCCCRWWLQL